MSQEEHILPEGRCFWSRLTAAAGRETALCGDLRHGVSERRAWGGGSGGQTHPQFSLQQEHRSPHLSPKAPSCCSLASAVSPYLSKFHMCSQAQSINSSLLTEQQVQQLHSHVKHLSFSLNSQNLSNISECQQYFLCKKCRFQNYQKTTASGPFSTESLYCKVNLAEKSNYSVGRNVVKEKGTS